eukprot:1188942-Prorocentrum_minimum.AAC.1
MATYKACQPTMGSGPHSPTGREVPWIASGLGGGKLHWNRGFSTETPPRPRTLISGHMATVQLPVRWSRIS